MGKSDLFFDGINVLLEDVDQTSLVVGFNSWSMMVEYDVFLDVLDLVLGDVDDTTWWSSWWLETKLIALIDNVLLEAIGRWSILSNDVALLDENVEVFHGVGVSWTTVSFEVVDQIPVAIEVNWSG